MPKQLRPTDIYTLEDGRELHFFAKDDQGRYLRPEQRDRWTTAIMEIYQDGQLQETALIVRKPETTPPVT